MAVAQLLAVGTNGASSGDSVITTTPLTVCLKDAAGPDIATGALVLVQLKDDAGQYFTINQLTNQQPSLVISGPGTYRFTRVAGVSCGVFSG